LTRKKRNISVNSKSKKCIEIVCKEKKEVIAPLTKERNKEATSLDKRGDVIRDRVK